MLSNKYMVDGASAILYEDVLKNFAAEQDTDEIIIIPSSVHEMLLLPKCDNDPRELGLCRNMVKEVKATLEEHLLLSNNIYIYNKKTEEISIWNG